jgi:RNA polymerase sigma factor (sigma-70 family)
MHRERPLARDTVLELDPPVEQVAPADRRLEIEEEEARIRFALELLDPDDRHLILRREWDGLDFARIGEELSISPDAARMRFHRALLRLQQRVGELSTGRLSDFLPESDGSGDD